MPSRDDQERYDREFLGIVFADYWRTNVRPLLRALRPYLEALQDEK